jgi:putative transposase
VLENSSSSQEAEDFQGRTTKPLTLLNEVTPEVQQKIDLIDAVLQARDRKSRSEAIQKASEVLDRTPRMIRMMVKRVETDGVATLGIGRKDKGQHIKTKRPGFHACRKHLVLLLPSGPDKV